jgi:hypothetical protein
LCVDVLLDELEPFDVVLWIEASDVALVVFNKKLKYTFEY